MYAAWVGVGLPAHYSQIEGLIAPNLAVLDVCSGHSDCGTQMCFLALCFEAGGRHGNQVLGLLGWRNTITALVQIVAPF